MVLDADLVRSLAAEVDPELGQQVAFVLELDRLKSVIRRSLLVDAGRHENTAEHSWHLAMMAMVMGGWAEPGTDLIRALKMVLVHDIVEIDAGDVYVYASDRDAEVKEAAERRAAERIFGLLGPVGDDLAALWEEYEERATPTARFAYAIDRLQPLLLNAGSGGVSWRNHRITEDQVRRINAPVGQLAEPLGRFVDELISSAVRAGALQPRGTAEPTGTVDVEQASGPSLAAARLQAILALRAQVFVVEQDCAYLDLDGRDLEPGTVHLWVDDDQGLAGYCRILAEPGGISRIGRVVTRPDRRGEGVSGRLLEAAIDRIGDTTPIVLGAQAHLVDFYSRFGFIPDGPGYDEDGIPHVPMARAPGRA
ncbi:MAG: GNAT family N-acetyltransferase [Acidimicrobiales bacterium]